MCYGRRGRRTGRVILPPWSFIRDALVAAWNWRASQKKAELSQVERDVVDLLSMMGPGENTARNLAASEIRGCLSGRDAALVDDALDSLRKSGRIVFEIPFQRHRVPLL